MPDYRSMYFKLYAIHCDVIELLQKVTMETEAMAMALDEGTKATPKDDGEGSLA